MDILSTAERLASIDRSAITFNPERCVHAHSHSATCEACYTICPVAAITLGTPPKFEPKACQTCLACLPVCPVGAYRADDAVQDLLACVTRIETKTIELICERHPDAHSGACAADGAVQVRGCLAGLGAGALVALAALGVEQATLRLDACAGCPWGALQGHIQRQVEVAQALLGGGPGVGALQCVGTVQPGVVHPRPVWQAANPPLSRRDLFRLAAQRGQMAAARAMSADQAENTSKHPGRDRRRINAALPRLKAVPAALDLGAYGYASLAVSEKCSACAACERACPTGALAIKLSESDGYRLSFTPADCVACGICVHACAPQAITLSQHAAFETVFGSQEPLVLRQGQLARCERCNTLFAAEGGAKLCPPCAERRQNPFGVRLPPDSEVARRLAERLSRK